MQDLFIEEEFIEKPHNPWKSFKIFYAVAVLQTLIVLGLKWFGLLEGYTVFYLFYMMFPPITAILMFRFPMKNIEVPRKTKLLGILGLTGCYFSTTLVLFICLVFYQYNGLFEVIRFALPLLCFLSIIVYILCSSLFWFSLIFGTRKNMADMQDLINEEEFIEKKSDYNPWRRFGVFYGIAFVFTMVYLVVQTYIEVSFPIPALIVLGLPFILAFIMVLHKRQNHGLPYSIVLLSIFGLMMGCFLAVFSIGIVMDLSGTYDSLLFIFYFMLVYIGLGLFCFAFMYPILRYKRKRLKQRP